MNLTLGDTRLIVDECKRQKLLRNQCAYVLATAYHETAHTMKPIKELGSVKYLTSKPYYPYVGRGYVQLTWKKNYERAGRELGVDFVKTPSLLMRASYAVPILVTGMREGWFTGKCLADYITLSKSDFNGARRIINGTDRANLIGTYAKTYDAMLKSDGYGEADKPADAPKPIPVPTPAPRPEAPQVKPVGGKAGLAVLFAAIISAVAWFWHAIVNFIHSIF